MSGPAWLPDTFAAVMIAVAVVSAGRILAAALRRAAVGTDADVAHVLMAVAMAGMLAAGLKFLPSGVWEVVFGLLTVWFAGRAALEVRGRAARDWRRACHLPHLVHSAAMLYMFLALRTFQAQGTAPAMGGGMGVSGGGMPLRAPTLALLFAVALAGFAVRDLDGITDPVASGLAHVVPAPVLRRPAFATAGGLAGPAPQLAAAVPVPVGTAVGPASFGETNPVPTVDGAAPPRPAGLLPALLSPRTAVACRVLMGVTMAYMLVVMI